MKLRLTAAACLMLLAGCAVGPNYKRPVVKVPDQFRGETPGGTATSLADTKWFDLFQDETLKQLVSTALEHNFDLAIAAQRIEEARARYGIQHAEQFPFVNAQASLTSQQTSAVGATPF